jgi:hypothetical protein
MPEPQRTAALADHDAVPRLRRRLRIPDGHTDARRPARLIILRSVPCAAT